MGICRSLPARAGVAMQLTCVLCVRLHALRARLTTSIHHRKHMELASTAASGAPQPLTLGNAPVEEVLQRGRLENHPAAPDQQEAAIP